MGDLAYMVRRFFKSDLLAFYGIGLVTLFILVWSVYAATRQKGAEFDVVKPGEKVLRVDGNTVTTIDPRYFTGTFITQQALFEGLVEFTRDLRVAPAAAERWDVSEDLLTYTFHLRKDRRWSNGDLVTAEDFRYAWIRVGNPRIAGGTWWYNSGLRFIRNFQEFGMGRNIPPEQIGIEAPDSWTLRVTLKSPTPDFPDSLLHPVCLPVPKKVVESCEKQGKDWTQPGNFVCNGPYIVEKWLFNSSMSLKPNPCWSGERGNLDRIILLLNAAGGVTAFENNEVDITPAGAIPDIRYCFRNTRLSGALVTSPTSTVHFLMPVKTQHPIMSDARFRRALTMGADLPKIVNTVAKGIYVPLTDFVPPVLSHVKERGLAFNAVEARRLLAEAEAATGGKCPVVNIMVPTQGPPLITILAGLKEEWEHNLGIKVNLENMEPGVWSARNAAIQPPGYLGYTYGAVFYIWDSQLEAIRQFTSVYLPFWDMPPKERMEFWQTCTENSDVISMLEESKQEEKRKRLEELGAKIDLYRTEKVGPTCRWLLDRAKEIATEKDASRQNDMLNEAMLKIDEEAWTIQYTYQMGWWLIQPKVHGVVLNPYLNSTIMYYRWINIENGKKDDG
ncbi:MAG: peptide ABC transporter substrate-binding protein [bacterium]|nr:peptide ABC transporter substrate-binding protein [Candidatus Sumerlaeota bacterium]